MIGSLSLNQKELKDILKEYYEKIYGDVEINFLAIDWEAKTKYGIRLTRSQRIGKEKLVKINEELEEEDIKEFLNNVFQDIGYNIENISFQPITNKQDFGEYTYLESLNIEFGKKTVKLKRL